MQMRPTRTVYTVGDFLDWQRKGNLRLKPIFQRRDVWKVKAKSLLIDTVVKGLPIPIVFLRSSQDLARLTSTLEVVDGQQRLRTLFSFVDPTVLSDFDETRDDFTVERVHNKEMAGKRFRDLPQDTQRDLLGYEISTHVFPPNTPDELILRIFSRINSTGANLNHQELRNARFFGAFKSLAYDTAIPHLPRWRNWGIFSEDDFARMQEVESVSDYLHAMMRGIQGKTQQKLDKLYQEFDDELDGADILKARFDTVMEAVDQEIGAVLPETRFRRAALFYSLFSAVYDHMYGLGTEFLKKRKATPLPNDIAARLQATDERIRAEELPEKVQDAMDRATADLGRRTTRHNFLKKRLGLATAG